MPADVSRQYTATFTDTENEMISPFAFSHFEQEQEELMKLKRSE